ncbi:efflux transporter outer membrane subunit [Novosphingobium sp.]|uniref:efflux transporter outer membrane subunit n=1 Tax=Novosphingobium sp. TaxID=1874826 RepID=UPI002B49FB3D|nr:efflux transporter outer membrane subunit [Novosphingobium sp.]HKR91274.1 efflux transporter outer membrane subunit [Novosphingobium sp.]
MGTHFRARVVAFSLLTATICLSACATPDLGPHPQMHAPAMLASGKSLSSVSPARNWPEERWWRIYGDPQLDALVDEALAGSPSLATAQARILQARGAAEAARAALLPSIDGQVSGGVTKQSYNNGIPANFVPHGWKSTGTLALSGDFDLDLWGKNRKLLAVATSEEAAAEADARQAELILSSNVVSSYFDLARLIERGESLADASRAHAELVDLTRQRSKAGLESEAPLRRSEAAAASARAALSANEEQVLLRRHAIAALLGAGPDRGLTITPPALRSLSESDLPMDAGIGLAGRRPDIVAARLRVEGTSARIDIAKAQFLPDISLRGLIGLTSLGISNLIESGSTYGNAGAALTLPIFQGGRLKGNFTQARGAYDAAVADYNATVVNALQEVADALVSRDAAAVQERDAAQAARTSLAGYDLAVKRYRAGLTNHLDALTAQTDALNARQVAVDAHFRTLALDVALKRALGGGFADNSSKKAPGNE